MTFLNKMGETISNKSKEVAKKAKELAEISSLNGQINSQEETINNTYVEIGKNYFEAHKDSIDDIYVAECNTIKTALDKIQQLKSEINKVKGVQNCPNCGAEVPAGTVFCSGCGSKVKTSESETSDSEADIIIESEVINKEPEVIIESEVFNTDSND